MTEEAAAFLRMRRHPLRMAIFDCDGVLIDSETLSNRVAAGMLSEAGWAMTEAECEQRFIGLTFSTMQRAAEAHLGRALGTDWVSRLVARTVDTMAREVEPMPGAREALDAVSRHGLAWRIASNSSHLEMNAKFGRAGWLDLVAGRVHSAAEIVARGGAAKPAPDVYLAAAEAEGIPPAHCLVVEDSAAGATAARAAGMDCLGFSRHGDNPRLREAGAVLFHSMHDFPVLLRKALI